MRRSFGMIGLALAATLAAGACRGEGSEVGESNYQTHDGDGPSGTAAGQTGAGAIGGMSGGSTEIGAGGSAGSQGDSLDRRRQGNTTGLSPEAPRPRTDIRDSADARRATPRSGGTTGARTP